MVQPRHPNFQKDLSIIWKNVCRRLDPITFRPYGETTGLPAIMDLEPTLLSGYVGETHCCIAGHYKALPLVSSSFVHALCLEARADYIQAQSLATITRWPFPPIQPVRKAVAMPGGSEGKDWKEILKASRRFARNTKQLARLRTRPCPLRWVTFTGLKQQQQLKPPLHDSASTYAQSWNLVEDVWMDSLAVSMAPSAPSEFV